MDEYKFRAREKLEAIHVAAITAAGTSKNRADEVLQQTLEAIRRLRESFHHLWQNEFIVEGRQKVAEWSRDTIQRIKDGAPPLSPILLYEELVTLFKDRVWRKSMLIFVIGACAGACCGVAAGLRLASPAPAGPHTRALHSSADTHVMLVEDAASPGASTGEVLVRVQAFSVDPIDRCVLRGRGATLRHLISSTHVTVGRGFAGVVLDVGPGVNQFELGDEVWGCLSEWSGGCASELLTLRSTRVSRRPRGLAADAAAALPWSGQLALAALRRLTWKKDWRNTRIAICNASTGEGCILTQVLSSWGARVTAHAPAHTKHSLMQLGAQDFIEAEGWDGLPRPPGLEPVLQLRSAREGPWDAVVLCGDGGGAVGRRVLKACAPRGGVVDLRARALLSDRLPGPAAVALAAAFYALTAARRLLGAGGHSDWLESPSRLSEGLAELANLVDTGVVAPVLDKVYLPQDFETALAHACSEDTLGTVVIRFP